MTKKIYLETFEKCPGSFHFPLLTPKKCLRCDKILPTTKLKIHTCAFMVSHSQELFTIQKCNYNV